MREIAGEELPQENRQRPAVEHDVVIGDHDPEMLRCAADQRHPERRSDGEVADRLALTCAQFLDLLLRLQLHEMPRYLGIFGDDLHGWFMFGAEAGGEVGMPSDRRAHRVAQPVRLQRSLDGDIELHRVQVSHLAVTVHRDAVEEQTVLQRCQRQDVGDALALGYLVDLVLRQQRRGDIRRCQTTPAARDVGADAGQSLEEQLAESTNPMLVENRGRPDQGGVQLRSGADVDGRRAEFDGVAQWHRHGGRGFGEGAAVHHGPPQFVRQAGTGEPAQIVEADRGVRSGHSAGGVQVAQQSVADTVGQGAQSFLGVLEDRTQCDVTGGDLGPARSVHAQCDRIFGGEPAHGPGQVHAGEQFLVATVTLDVDAQQCPGRQVETLGAGQAEGDQHDVVDSGVKRGGHPAEQWSRGVRVQRRGVPARTAIGVASRVGRGDRGTGRLDVSPAFGTVDDRC
ncbi:hypothetical protein MDUV_05830 [Mycolicibacterium duvalii]|uniref:Uncharacterized protein n=1 Tax=Mycolicibacterium duvalii TaxID=39688 RepID=A0A7I7JV92_9MYCO|nr:hypothetical protein MDUV_05830 [Mycolicibacterium duvalii]